MGTVLCGTGNGNAKISVPNCTVLQSETRLLCVSSWWDTPRWQLEVCRPHLFCVVLHFQTSGILIYIMSFCFFGKRTRSYWLLKWWKKEVMQPLGGTTPVPSPASYWPRRWLTVVIQNRTCHSFWLCSPPSLNEVYRPQPPPPPIWRGMPSHTAAERTCYLFKHKGDKRRTHRYCRLCDIISLTPQPFSPLRVSVGAEMFTRVKLWENQINVCDCVHVWEVAVCVVVSQRCASD